MLNEIINLSKLSEGNGWGRRARAPDFLSYSDERAGKNFVERQMPVVY